MSLKKKTRTFDSIKETNETSGQAKSDIIPNGTAPTISTNKLSKTLPINDLTLSDKRNNFKNLNSNSISSMKSHFSPQTSIRIKVIDEVDGDS